MTYLIFLLMTVKVINRWNGKGLIYKSYSEKFCSQSHQSTMFKILGSDLLGSYSKIEEHAVIHKANQPIEIQINKNLNLKQIVISCFHNKKLGLLNKYILEHLFIKNFTKVLIVFLWKIGKKKNVKKLDFFSHKNYSSLTNNLSISINKILKNLSMRMGLQLLFWLWLVGNPIKKWFGLGLASNCTGPIRILTVDTCHDLDGSNTTGI